MFLKTQCFLLLKLLGFFLQCADPFSDFCLQLDIMLSMIKCDMNLCVFMYVCTQHAFEVPLFWRWTTPLSYSKSSPCSLVRMGKLSAGPSIDKML